MAEMVIQRNEHRREGRRETINSGFRQYSTMVKKTKQKNVDPVWHWSVTETLRAMVPTSEKVHNNSTYHIDLLEE